jgi:hypothetical protein
MRRITARSMKQIPPTGSTTLVPYSSINHFFSKPAHPGARPTFTHATTSLSSNRLRKIHFVIPTRRRAATRLCLAYGSPGIRLTRCTLLPQSSLHEKDHHRSWDSITSMPTDAISTTRATSSSPIIRGAPSVKGEKSGTSCFWGIAICGLCCMGGSIAWRGIRITIRRRRR